MAFAHTMPVSREMSVLGLARAVAPASMFRLARFPPCTAARAHARLWYYRKVRFRWQAPTDRPKISIKRRVCSAANRSRCR